MMRNHLHEPIFFTPPTGDTKRPRRLYKGASGDGGAAERQAAEDARVAAAIQKINEIFGVSQAQPETVDRAAFTKTVPSNSTAANPSGIFSAVSTGNVVPTSTAFGGFNGINNFGKTQTVFDQAGYDAAVAAAAEKAKKLSTAASDREKLYSTIGSDATNNALLDLNKDRAITERELNFMLARAGLSGGSRDVDVNKDILDTYQQGVLKATNSGLSTANNARSADDTTRVNLINSIRSGLDAGSAQQQAYQDMQNNARTAQDNANANGLAGFFDALKTQQQNAAYTNGVASTTIPQQTKSTPYSSAINGDRGKTNSY